MSKWIELSAAAAEKGISRLAYLQKALDGELTVWVQHEVTNNIMGQGLPFSVYPGKLVSAADAPDGFKIAMPNDEYLMFDSQRIGLRGGRFEVTPRVTANMELLRSVRSAGDYMPIELKRGVILRDVGGNYYLVEGIGPAAMVQVGVREIVDSTDDVSHEAPKQELQRNKGSAKVWSDERIRELKAFKDSHTAEQTAMHFDISKKRVYELLEKIKPKKATVFKGL